LFDGSSINIEQLSKKHPRNPEEIYNPYRKQAYKLPEGVLLSVKMACGQSVVVLK